MPDSKQLIELNEKLVEKQKALALVFEEAGVAGDNSVDFAKVKCLGEGLSQLKVAEKVREMDKELNDLVDQVEAQAAAEGAAEKGALKRLEQMRHATSGGDPADQSQKGAPGTKEVPKSFAEHIVTDEYREFFVKQRQKGGLTMAVDAWPSEMGIGPRTVYGLKGAQTTQVKTLFQTSAGWDPEYFRQPGFVEDVTRPIQLLDIIPGGRTDSDTISYMEETTRTHSAAEKSEGSAFAESAFAFTEQTSAVRKITDSLPVTDEQLEDVQLIGSYINGRLVFGVRQRLDTQVLVGDGIAPNLDGILNVSGIQTQALGTDSRPDAFFKAGTLVRVTGRAMPTHNIMHSTDWEKIRLLTTADGVYIWGSPSEAGPERMWGRPVVQTEAGSAGTGYVGSFLPSWIMLFERRGVDVQVGYSGTLFEEGKRLVRADGRWAFVLFRPAAFCSVTGL